MPCFCRPWQTHLILCIIQLLYSGEKNKLDSFVMVAVLGFHSIDCTIESSQWLYGPEESRPNYIKGSRKDISLYLIEHFCSPSGTILDLSNDPKGDAIVIQGMEIS